MSEQKKEHEEEKEFGGPIGNLCIMIGSHIILYYLLFCWKFNKGEVFVPASFNAESIMEFLRTCKPNWGSLVFYLGFIAFQLTLAFVAPGITTKGAPLKHLGGKQLWYKCNAFVSFYTTIIVIALIHYSKDIPWNLSHIHGNFGPIMSTAIIFGDILAVVTFVLSFALKKTHRMTGNLIYDFFMGAPLNPRLGKVDLKLFAEGRVSWNLLLLLTVSAASYQFDTYGSVSLPMIFMIYAHFLYSNAVAKGEEFIPTTWDIFYEKWGWMLIWWNFAGVPFVYTFNSYFLATRPPYQSAYHLEYVWFAVLTMAYYFWDVIQMQRNSFRMKLNGSFVERKTVFPRFSQGIMEADAKHLVTKTGSRLLVDGLWKYGRKLHYSADIVMAFSWAGICGFTHFLPFFYVSFFLGMILHRASRDIERCSAKYGDDWVTYTKMVPYIFIPGVF